MTLAGWLHRYRLPVLSVAFVLTIAGIYAAISLPVGLFPLTSFPRITSRSTRAANIAWSRGWTTSA